MKVEAAFDLEKVVQESYQNAFPTDTDCCYCHGNSRLAFVAYDEYEYEHREGYVCDLHDNLKDGKLWLHDLMAVAVYFCEECLKPTALYNQA